MRYVAGSLLNVMLLAALFLAAAALAFTLAGPRLFGLDARTLYTNSMAPAIPAGSLEIVRAVDPRAIQEGDVILFNSPWNPSQQVSHRVMEIEREGGQLAFRTKGDANESADPRPVPTGQVRGKVVAHVPWLGYVTAFVRTPLGFLLLLVVPSLFIAWGEMRNIASALREGRREAERTRQRTPCDEGGQESVQ